MKTVISLCISLLVHYCTALAQNGDQRPNVIILLVDDLGYGDLGSFGHPDIRTPNLDGLAAEGMKLTNCYSSSPMCSPSRAGMLTGRVPYRTGVYDWIAPDSTMYLPDSEVTLASLLKQEGYQTYHGGKWHLNGKFNVDDQPQPGDHGFDYWFGIQFNVGHLDPEGFVLNGAEVVTRGYACDIVADEAIDWLGNIRDKTKPFFQYINFLEPHHPIMSPPELVEQYAKNGIKAEYFANVSNLDSAIGKIIKALEAMDLSENTFIFFTSDNGPGKYNPRGIYSKSHGSAGPLKGYKRYMYEGGIRVPGIIRWPGFVKAGSISEEPISNVDLLPTVCSIVGIDLPSDRIIDGSDITPVFENKPVARSIPLHWHFYDPSGGPQSIIRKGDYMVGAYWDVGIFHKRGRFDPMRDVAYIKKSKLAEFEMYNLAEDVHQDQNIKLDKPKLFEELSSELKQLHQSVMDEAPFIGN